MIVLLVVFATFFVYLGVGMVVFGHGFTAATRPSMPHDRRDGWLMMTLCWIWPMLMLLLPALWLVDVAREPLDPPGA